MQDLEEKRLAHYSIQRRLARGGMSQVYLAFDEHTQYNVAIKVVHCSEDDYFVRFQREVKTLSALSHEHILPIIESGVHGSWQKLVASLNRSHLRCNLLMTMAYSTVTSSPQISCSKMSAIFIWRILGSLKT